MDVSALDAPARATQYAIKSRVHELPDYQFRGYVEITARSPASVESRLKYSPILRQTWDEAITDAELLAERVLREECTDGEAHIFSARTASSFDRVMNILAAHGLAA